MSGRILVIDDNAANLELMRYLLQAYGFETIGVADGASGLEIASSFDLTISDVLMPGMDGYELARRFRESPDLRDRKLIAVTALAMPGDRERLTAVGFDGYLAKPIDPASFASTIASYLSNQSAEGRLVLVVDDDSANRLLLRTILEYGGYTVAEAADAEQGLRETRERLPDLVIVDLYMPTMNGVAFVKALRADPRIAETLIALHTATPSSAALADFMELAGIVCSIPKPCEPTDVLRLVGGAITAGRDRG
jgi:CheY-like chemotaxis protein